MLAQIDDILLPSNLQGAFDSSSDIRASMDPAEDEVQQVMERANTLFGVAPHNCERRALLTVTKNASAPRFTVCHTQAGVTPGAQHLARIYGLYKLAALRDISSAHDSVSPSFFESVIAGLNFTA
jgi:hypothetical protein